MSDRKPAAIPPAPRKTLLQWIDGDDGDTTGLAPPACSAQARTLHAAIVSDCQDGEGCERHEPLAPPRGLRLAPLG